MQNIELHGRIGQLIDNDDSETVYNLGARFHSTQQLSLGADFKTTVLTISNLCCQRVSLTKFHWQSSYTDTELPN